MTTETLPLDDKFVIKFDRPAYTRVEWAKACGYGITTIKDAITDGKLVESFANTKGVITLEEGMRWLRSLPQEPPAAGRRAS